MRTLPFRLQIALSTVAVLVVRPSGRHALSPRHRLARATWHPVRTVLLAAVAVISGLFVVSSVVGAAFAGPTPPADLSVTAAKYAAVYAGQQSDPTLAGLAGRAAVPAAAPASMTPTEPYELWRFRDGRVCVQDNGWNWWPAAQAGADWRQAAGVDVVVWDSCASQPRGMTIIMRTYRSPENACAKTASESNAYTWARVDDDDTWVPDVMTIWLNTDPSRAAGCTATAGLRAHVIAHELGHAIGMAHVPTGEASIMAFGNYGPHPTALDLTRAGYLYGPKPGTYATKTGRW